jgi:L-lactate dehydrogenase
MVLRDERSVIPIGSYQPKFGVTLSLPSIVGSCGVMAILPPDLSPEERNGLQKSVENLRKALEDVNS